VFGACYDEMVGEVTGYMHFEHGYDLRGQQRRHWRVDLEPDDPGVTLQGQHGPIPKVFVERNQNSVVADRIVQDFAIAGTGQTRLRGSNHIVARIPERLREVNSEHLVEVQAHMSGRDRFGNIGVLNNRRRVHQSGVDIFLPQLRVVL